MIDLVAEAEERQGFGEASPPGSPCSYLTIGTTSFCCSTNSAAEGLRLDIDNNQPTLQADRQSVAQQAAHAAPHIKRQAVMHGIPKCEVKTDRRMDTFVTP